MKKTKVVFEGEFGFVSREIDAKTGKEIPFSLRIDREKISRALAEIRYAIGQMAVGGESIAILPWIAAAVAMTKEWRNGPRF